MYTIRRLCLLMFVIIEDHFLGFTNGLGCKPNEFACNNDQCIDPLKVCDGAMDCLDWSDEQGCDKECEKPNWFYCYNKECVSSSFVCDGTNDCGDFSDEQNCTSFKVRGNDEKCGDKEWQCLDRLCIREEWVCNGEPDCLDGSDETLGCTRNVTCDGFRCKNDHCIPSEWHCDGNPDCQDGSDELDCEHVMDQRECNITTGQEFMCADKTCIKAKYVCDKVAHCPDKSDEGAACFTESEECARAKCSQSCIKTARGHQCLCFPGYHLTNGTACLDVNECNEYGICDQKCRNTVGSYECFCEENFVLQKDKRSCKANGGEALMVFSTKKEIRGFFLDSKLYFPIAQNLKQAIGVDFDGRYVYWTEIFSESESIVKSWEDGSHREMLVTSGLGGPEDLAIDWITGNIYFTDVEMQHIAACTNDGMHCAILLEEHINKPRGIVVNPLAGEMFWTDWGKKPEIGRAFMDGSSDISFVSNNIFWPNGLALDVHNERLYWTDAKFMTIESIRLDGTERRVVLEKIVKHPYAIGVFENRLYWSDWATNSVQACDKFTGKNHHTLIKAQGDFVYGLRIHHPYVKTARKNSCANSLCSDICLLKGSGYTCACTQDRKLKDNNVTCEEIESKQVLFIGANNLIIRMHHQRLGKHDIVGFPSVVEQMGALACNFNGTLYVSDVKNKRIVEVNLDGGRNSILLNRDVGNVTSLSFDYLGNNLYWCDSERKVVEVMSLTTLARKVLLHDMMEETPLSMALVPDEGIMFVAFERAFGAHIDRFHMDGSGRTHVIEQGLLLPVQMFYDSHLNRIFWADAGTGNIESTSSDGDDRHGFRSLQTAPVGVASLNEDIFWTNRDSRRIYWADKKNLQRSHNRKITLDLPHNVKVLHLVSATRTTYTYHPCLRNNGNCSHLCLVGYRRMICSCPFGMHLDTDGKTCVNDQLCRLDDFFCKSSSVCIPQMKRCDGHKDCTFGEDEANCLHNKTDCSGGEFRCDDGKCISERLVCDYRYDCADKSDEDNCFSSMQKHHCGGDEFSCHDRTECVNKSAICDGKHDCHDKSDELFCKGDKCGRNDFKCLSQQCIPRHWECDQEPDCADFSDEHENCPYKACNDSMFRCNNGYCLKSDSVCNERDDCGDSSDEIDCTKCSANEFACSKSATCVSKLSRCNGTSECINGEDEQDCNTKNDDCRRDEFRCTNGRCISVEWLCDKNNDCEDGLDESTRFCSFDSTTTTICNNFRCKSGECIDYSLVCNGENDCEDASDENGACSSACRIDSSPCQQKCLKTPNGPKCACSDGFELQGDGHTCLDVKECSASPPRCSQICTEKTGSFECSCHEGFQLRVDGVTCKSIGEPMSVLYVSFNEIHQFVPNRKESKAIYLENVPTITGFDVVANSSQIYFSIGQLGIINRVNSLTKQADYLINLGNPSLVNVDWISDNIYYYDGASKSIRACSFAKMACSNLVSFDAHDQVTALSVDAYNKHFFYVETHWWMYSFPTSSIFRRNLHGSNVTTIEKSGGTYVTTLVNDPYEKHLYFCDENLGIVYRVDYDGSDKIVVLRDVYKPIGLAVFESYLYFAKKNGHISRCPLYFDYDSCKEIEMDLSKPSMFKLLQISQQPYTVNNCHENNCSHVCVPTETSYVCLDNDAKAVKTAQFYNNSTFLKQTDPRGNTADVNHGYAHVTLLLIAMICVASCTYYWYFHKKAKDNSFIAMRFHNPMYGCEPPENVLKPGEHEYSNPLTGNTLKPSQN